MTTCLGKSCPFALPRVPFVNCCHFMHLVISFLVLRAGYGVLLYQFLIIAYLFTFYTISKEPKQYSVDACIQDGLHFSKCWLISKSLDMSLKDIKFLYFELQKRITKIQSARYETEAGETPAAINMFLV